MTAALLYNNHYFNEGREIPRQRWGCLIKYPNLWNNLTDKEAKEKKLLGFPKNRSIMKILIYIILMLKYLFSFNKIPIRLNRINALCGMNAGKPYLCNGWVPSDHLARAVGLMLMRDLHSGGPLVQEAIGGVKAAVSHSRFLLEIFTHAITIVVIAHAWLLCRWACSGRRRNSKNLIYTEFKETQSLKPEWATRVEKPPLNRNKPWSGPDMDIGGWRWPS